jgi:hypothetical protein
LEDDTAVGAIVDVVVKAKHENEIDVCWMCFPQLNSHVVKVKASEVRSRYFKTLGKGYFPKEVGYK